MCELTTIMKERIDIALKAAEARGIMITNDDIMPIIRDLSLVFDNMWEDVEADDYNVVFDIYFNKKESELTFFSEQESEGSKPVYDMPDISKSTEQVPIPLVAGSGKVSLPKFNYIPTKLDFSLSRIEDEDCCQGCSGNCLSAAIPCACAHETGGVFAYTSEGRLRDEFLRDVLSLKRDPEEHQLVFCDGYCHIEKSKKCKGHVVMRFIKECRRKCGCNMDCGNLVVQRGILGKLQIGGQNKF